MNFLLKKLIVVFFTFFTLLSFQNSVFAQSKSDDFIITPINIAWFSPFELVPFKPRRVVGVSANVFYGHEDELYGVQAGMVSRTLSGIGVQAGLVQIANNDFIGVQAGGFNYAGDFWGIQVSGMNVAADGFGVQVAAVTNHSNDFSGIQISSSMNDADYFNGIQISAGLNRSFRNFSGLQIGLHNQIQVKVPVKDLLNVGGTLVPIYGQKKTSRKGMGNGAQIGLWNESVLANGIQIGVVNISEDINGVQIGLINYADSLKGIQIGLLNFHANGVFGAPVFNLGW
ncbi:MAG: hypothetical protein HOI23_23010 [Deltaproteobacteria bacterium]|jgi:hypothetical protein|nr:hypothetical protein [Deltaproteobacteria bacterium]MBT6435733.1 hypothetical protein [Deltaproteobacteria bacterium]